MYRFIRGIQNWKNKSKSPFVILKFIFIFIFNDFFNVILKDLVEYFLGVVFLL